MADPLSLTVAELLEELAERRRVPGAGSLAALVTAAAAAVVARGARYSAAWPDAEGVVAQAETLRARTAPLAALDAERFDEALAALGEPEEPDAERRNWQLGRALEEAAGIPLRIVEAAADVAELAAVVAERGSLELRPDVAAAAALAEAGARMGAHLVAINLGAGPDDERVRRADRLVEAARDAARRALAHA